MGDFSQLMDKAYKAIIAKDRWKIYLEGLGNTLMIAAVSCLIGLAIAVVVAIVKYTAAQRRGFGWKAAAWVCNLYTTVIRGTPIILQLLIIYSVTVWTKGTVACFIGFGINSGAYVSEIIRSGINSVDIGQTEAARSLGMSSGQAMRIIILPQAVVRMIPPLGNEFIALIKNSALVSLLTIHDLMHEGQKIISVSYRSLETYLVVALIYLVLTTAAMLILRRIEQRLRAGGMVQ